MTCQRNYSEKSGSEGSEDDDYVPYVPVKIRKQQMVRTATNIAAWPFFFVRNVFFLWWWFYGSLPLSLLLLDVTTWILKNNISCFCCCMSQLPNCLCLFDLNLRSIRWCVFVGKDSWRRNRKTVVESRKMKMRVWVPDPMSVCWTNTNTSKRKLKVFAPSPSLHYWFTV